MFAKIQSPLYKKMYINYPKFKCAKFLMGADYERQEKNSNGILAK